MGIQPTRRTLLGAFAAAPLAGAAASGRPIRLGGPIFLKNAEAGTELHGTTGHVAVRPPRESDDPRELARDHRRLGYSAAYCPPSKPDDTAHTRAIAEAFAAENVVLAEVGAWCNMMDPDAEKRRANLRYVTERLALAEAVGSRCCVDYSGSFNPKVPWGPNPGNLSKEFFDGTVENCRQVLDAIKPKRTTFTIEMMGWSVPDNPDNYLKLIRAVDRKQFAVHLDVCNGINCPTKFYNSAAYIEECFHKLGRWIVSCHAKDLAWIVELNVHFQEVIPGRGSVDYHAYLREISKLPVDAPLMLEHLKTPEEYEEGKTYILKIGGETGVRFV